MAMRPPTSPGNSARPRPEPFRLTGPSVRLDHRVNAYRPDIADVALAGQLFAPHYAQAIVAGCTAPAAMLRATPSPDVRAVSQLLLGEAFAVLDVAGGWAWGRCLHDDYVGYLPAAALGMPVAPDHIVAVPRAPRFAAADIKSPMRDVLPIGARLAGVVAGDFLETADGFVHHRHVARLDTRARDWVTVAERLIGLPYLWGGRGGDGIDCSGLVQVALAQAGIAAPRDSDMQRAALGRPLAEGEALERGDLVFMPGHVGLMVDATRLIHANGHWMAVTIEPLADAIARLPVDAAVTARRI